MLLSLIAKQHCIIESEEERMEDLGREVRAASGEVFGLKAAIVDCKREMTMEQFWGGIMIEEDEGEEDRMVGGFSFDVNSGISVRLSQA